MKKIVLTAVIMLIVSMSAFANFDRSSLVSLNRSNIVNTFLFNDSIKSNETKTATQLSRVAFYDVDHIVITNTKKQYIRIEDTKGNTILESYENIDIKLAAGTYYVYTNCAHLVALYR